MDYARHTRFSDPRQHAPLLAALPDDVAGIAEAVRNLVVHYRASGLEFPPERLAEIDNRWVDRMLDADRSRFATPLREPRPIEQRIVGCCRDFTLLTVAALRQKGIPARSRVGFAGYLDPDYHTDHVIVEHHDGRRWIAMDPQLDLADVPFTPDGLLTAAQSWQAYRRGRIDPSRFGVMPGSPICGPWMIGNYVLLEAAHRRGDEVLLWDVWGDAGPFVAELGDLPLPELWASLPAQPEEYVALVDEVADLLLAADAGDEAAEQKLASRYEEDRRLRVGDTVVCHSPRGIRYEVDLRR